MRLPRLAVRGFDTVMPEPRRGDPARVLESDVEIRMPGDRRSSLGVRVASDPDTLLEFLSAVPESPDALSIAAIVAFLRRPDVHAALRAAAKRRPELVRREGAVARLLREELGA